MKNKLLISMISIIMLVSVVLVGCSKSGNSTDSPNTDDAVKSADTSNDAAKSDGPVTIRLNFSDGEISKDQIAEFEASHPNIKIERIDADYNKLMAMIAAGTAPDIIRLSGATELPAFVTRGLALNLTPYFNDSTVFKADDFLPVVDLFKFDGKTQGVGDIYGLPKDWSPDFSLIYNKKLFTAAGVPFPSATEPMTWDELFALGQKFTKKEGSKITQFGFQNIFSGGVSANQDVLLVQLKQLGKDLFGADGKVDFTTPESKQILKMWVDAAKAGIGGSPLNTGTPWTLLGTDELPILMTGYWLTGWMRGDPSTKDHLDDFAMAPTPIMKGGTRVSATQSATGGIIFSKTKHPNEAWEVFEWYFGGKPADDRAKSGWGLPVFKSKMAMLPQETDFDKQTYQVVQSELPYVQTMGYSPFVSSAGMGSIFDKDFTAVYFDKDTIDGATEKMNTDVNNLVLEGKDIAGVK